MNAQAPPTKSFSVLIEETSFRPDFLPILRIYGNLVATQVDLLIPGDANEYPLGGIIVFQGSQEFERTTNHQGPITLVGPKVEGEPPATTGGVIRIAVSGIDMLYVKRFVYQLSHELAHVKMGVRVDNALIETFAVAVSYEVLRRLSFHDYLIPVIQKDIRALPEDAQQQLADGDFASLRKLWQNRCGREFFRMDDRPAQTLGALLLQMAGQPIWPLLLNISDLTIDSTVPTSISLALLPPDIPAIARRGLPLTSLGYEIVESR